MMVTVWRVPQKMCDQTAEIARLQKLVVEHEGAVQALTERNIELRDERATVTQERDRLRDAANDVVCQYPLIHGSPVPAWIRNLNIALRNPPANGGAAMNKDLEAVARAIHEAGAPAYCWVEEDEARKRKPRKQARAALEADPVRRDVVEYFERFCAHLDEADRPVCEVEIEFLARLKAQTEE